MDKVSEKIITKKMRNGNEASQKKKIKNWVRSNKRNNSDNFEG